MPNKDVCYICDASSLINLHRHFKEKAIKALRRLAQKNRLKLPEGVCRELMRGTDELRRFVQKKRDKIEVTVTQDARLKEEIKRLERNYGRYIQLGQVRYSGFWKSKAGRKAADAQVVAVAKVKGYICVSDDQAIKLACALENVECIQWTEFARRLKLQKQRELF